jgi:uncharacterized protein (UPF0335 family)
MNNNFVHPRKNVSSCSVLEAYRNSNSKLNSSKSIIDRVHRKNTESDGEEELEAFMERIGDQFVPYIKTQKGSRFMQKFLNKITSEKVTFLLSKICQDLKEIMCDFYGNYFIQKLIQTCSSNQRIFILKYVTEIF